MTKDELADQLIAILFPPLEQDKDGWWSARNVRDIEGAIYDIELAGGRCDEVCMRTLKRIETTLASAAQLAEPFRKKRVLYQAPSDAEHPRGISHDAASKIVADFGSAQSDFGRRLVPRYMPPVDPTIEAEDPA